MKTVSREDRLAAEDRIWDECAAASARAQNRYYRRASAANDAFRAGGPYLPLERELKAAWSEREGAIEAALAAYRVAMGALEV